ncbi:leucine dehydrogenase [bacterium]|nr:leucine dehydrogenase [bacterium]
MDFFNTMGRTSCKKMVIINEPQVGLKGVIAINNNTLGPSVCSCKIYPYKSIDNAINDALQIASFNTCRAALTHTDVGGGSIILIGDPDTDKSEFYFRTVGIYIQQFKGDLYITAESGVTEQDMLYVKKETPYVLGLSEKYGGSGNRAKHTAQTVLQGMKAAAKERFGEASLKGKKISLQGLGYVGEALIRLLVDEGAILTVTDLDYDKIKQIQDINSSIKAVKPKEIYSVEADIFSPCAFSSLMTLDNAKELKASIIAGSANNVFENDEAENYIIDNGVLYIPGFVINAGDIIQVSNELKGMSEEKTDEEIKQIFYKTIKLIQKSKDSKKSVKYHALLEAKEYIDAISSVKMLR